MTLSPCRTLRNVIHTQKCVPCRKYAKPKLIDVYESMGELLNRFFASVEQGHGDRNVARGEGDQAEVGDGVGEGISVVITEVMAREHLARLGENKTPGTDGMGSSFVKNLVGGIEMPLVLLFQRSLETGQVPEQWMEANVTAIYERKGKRCDPGNYRSVSSTSQVGKLFERLLSETTWLSS